MNAIVDSSERLVRAKARMHFAQKRAGDAALLAKAAEEAYVSACHELRECERELESLREALPARDRRFP